MRDEGTVGPRQWKRIEELIAAGPAHVHLDTSEDGACVVIEGLGVLHPLAYLDLMEDEPRLAVVRSALEREELSGGNKLFPDDIRRRVASLLGKSLRRYKEAKGTR